MINTTGDQFNQMFLRLRVAYPILRNMAEDEWALTCDTYWKALRVYSPDLIGRVFDQAVKHWTDFFPTAGQLAQSALAIYKRLQENNPQPEQKQLLADPGPRPSAGDNPFSQVAQVWYDESRALGLHPDSTTPEHISKRRFKEFWIAWDLTEKLAKQKLNKQKGM